MLSLAVAALVPLQDPRDPDAVLSEIVVTGTRLPSRTATKSPAPIDVLSRQDLVSTGAVGDELGQAISVLAPSFNFPRQSNSGTSDHIRAGQLRGLSPAINFLGNLPHDILSPVGINGRYLYTRLKARF